MKSPFIILSAALAAMTVLGSAHGAEAKNAKTPQTLEEQEAARQAALAKVYQITGGFLDRENTPGRRFAFLNMQGIVPQADIMAPEETMTRIMRRVIVVEKFDGRFAVNDAEALMKKADVAGAVFLIDDPALPRILVAPESKWAMINVAALNSDKPDKLVLGLRVRNEMWRTFAMLNGAANSRSNVCVMHTVFSNADLDALPARAFCPEKMGTIMVHLDRTDIKKKEQCSYKAACEEGWAPMPTNEVQKAIYESVKAEQSKSPSKGLQINYDPKAGK